MTKSDDFDPYLKWLGIRDPDRPPNHYRLLGLELFEADADVIATAADRQMAHIRRFQHGSHVDLTQQLLNQLAAAKVCLLRSDSKAAYDDELRQSLELAKVSAQSNRPLQGSSITRSRHRARLVGVSIAGLTLSLAVTLLLVWRGRQRSIAFDPADSAHTAMEPREHDRAASEAAPNLSARRPPDATPPSASARDDDDSSIELPAPDIAAQPGTSPPPGADDTIPESSEDDSDEIDALAPLRAPTATPQLRRAGEHGRVAPDPRTFTPARGPDPQPVQELEVMASESDPEEIALTGLDAPGGGASPGTFARLRMALQSRDLEEAATLIEQLEQESNSYTQREATDRMRLVLYQLEQFWNAVQKGLALLQPGVELTVAGQPVKVVDVKPERVVFQIGDEQKSMATDRPSIDSGLAMTLATLHYMRVGALPQPAMAAFLAVDHAGNPNLAAKIWREMRQRNMATPLPVRESRPRAAAPTSSR
jgi:hypothetical protein